MWMEIGLLATFLTREEKKGEQAENNAVSSYDPIITDKSNISEVLLLVKLSQHNTHSRHIASPV